MKPTEQPGAQKLATVYQCFRCRRSFKVPYGQPPEGVELWTLEPPSPATEPIRPLKLQSTSGAMCSGCVMKVAELLKLDVTDGTT